MFPRSVSTTRRIHARVHPLKDGCLYTLTYEVMPMRNFKHITPWLSHNFPQVQSNHSTTSRLFNLWTFSLCNFWLTRTSPCANYHTVRRDCVQLIT